MSDTHRRVGFKRVKVTMTAEALKDRLEAAEKAPDRKNTFYVYVPMEDDYQPPKHPSVASSS